MKKPPVCYFCGCRHWFIDLWGPLLLKVLVVVFLLTLGVYIAVALGGLGR